MKEEVFFFEKKKQKTFVCLVLAIILTGCAVGPNFAPPPPPKTLAAAPAMQNITQQWWELFGSATLDQAIQTGLAHSPNLASEQAALRAAQAQYRATAGALYPQISGNLNATRESTPFGAQTLTESISQAGITMNYALDIWGGNRRNAEEQAANVDDARFILADTRITLASNIAQTMITIASLRDQIEATHQILAAEQQSRDLINQQLSLGSKTRADLLQQDAQIAQTRSTLPPLAQQLDRAGHLLAALSGLEAAATATPGIQLADLSLPHDLPSALPANLIEQRPDIMEQQALLHARTAALGVATANMLPAITLSANDTLLNETVAGITENGINLWSLGAGLTQPLFEGGTLRALRAEARAQLDEQAATYQQTVVSALQNVADSLTASQHDRDAVAADAAYETAAQASLDFTRAQYQIGATDFTTLLTQEVTYQQARLTHIQAVAAQYQDAVLLYQSLGGGWWAQPQAALGAKS